MGAKYFSPTELKEAFGEENVFFDDWSIKPGENIVGRMSEGLEEYEFFFFFITENSLNSEMVRLEWTTALKEKNNRGIEFIPITASNVNVPMIISTLKYLNLYKDGIETTVKQIRDIVNGVEKSKRYPTFKNIRAYALQERKNTVLFFVTVKRFYEPNSIFLLLTELTKEEVEFKKKGGLSQTKYFEGITETRDGISLNEFLVDTKDGLHKGFKEELVLIKNSDRDKQIILTHVTGEKSFETIDVQAINSQDEIELN